MRKTAFVGLIVGLFSLAALAAETDHPKAEFYGGYQYSHLEGGVNANGFNFGATGNFNSSFGITADFGSSFATQNGISLHNYTYTFGPQMALRTKKGYTPFVHALFGGDHGSASFADITGTGNGFALLAGGASILTTIASWLSGLARTGCWCTAIAPPAPRTSACRSAWCSSSSLGGETEGRPSRPPFFTDRCPW